MERNPLTALFLMQGNETVKLISGFVTYAVEWSFLLMDFGGTEQTRYLGCRFPSKTTDTDLAAHLSIGVERASVETMDLFEAN